MQITQWNCSSQDNFDEAYLEQALENSNLCLLQRCKDRFLHVAMNKFNNYFKTSHSADRSLVIGSNYEISDQKHFELPTYNHIDIYKHDSNQGSMAQSIVIKDLQIINFQIAFEDHSISRQWTYDDFEYIFENIVQHDNCLMVGDIHYEPDTPKNFESLIKQHNFKNNTNNIVTFSKIVDGVAHGFRHDRILTKGKVDVHNIQTFAKPHNHGNAHWIINYNV